VLVTRNTRDFGRVPGYSWRTGQPELQTARPFHHKKSRKKSGLFFRPPAHVGQNRKSAVLPAHAKQPNRNTNCHHSTGLHRRLVSVGVRVSKGSTSQYKPLLTRGLLPPYTLVRTAIEENLVRGSACAMSPSCHTHSPCLRRCLGARSGKAQQFIGD
jgi:hypothetical protein